MLRETEPDTPEGDVAEEFGQILNISTLPNEVPGTNREDNVTPRNETGRNVERANEEYWLSQVDLSHVEDPEFRSEITAMLRKYSSLWDRSLGSISVIEHRIDVDAGSKPILSIH